MGRITDFDHFKVGDDLDIATWDSYPIGFLADRAGASEEKQRRYMRQGDLIFRPFITIYIAVSARGVGGSWNNNLAP